MQIVSPCCQKVQEYSPRDGKLVYSTRKKRRTTKCKDCGKAFDIKKDIVVKKTIDDSLKNQKKSSKKPMKYLSRTQYILNTVSLPLIPLTE